MKWYYNNSPILELNDMPPKAIGFIYKITNTKSNKYYIGKKNLFFTRSRPPLKGNKNKRKFTTESDWLTYNGSSNKLLIDIKRYGIANFKREILIYCNSKRELAYDEAHLQFTTNCLFDINSYNEMINCRIGNKK